MSEGLRPRKGETMDNKYYDLEKLAADIYTEVYGDVDDKQFHADKETEILDWLTDGDIADYATLQSLVADWRKQEGEAKLMAILFPAEDS